jgi:hypothetical protein
MAGKKILLVEGIEDKHVLKHLCYERHVGLLDEDIKGQGNDTKLLENLPVELQRTDIEVLGVVLDADTGVMGRWDALKQRFTQAGYSGIPAQPETNGTVLDPPPHGLLPRIGVWIMPDNRSAGKLEDFLLLLVPEGSRLFEHVEISVQRIPDGERRFSKPDETKAIIYTWLAWQKEPGRPFGTAIRAKYLDSNSSHADALVAWLKRLFFPRVPPS